MELFDELLDANVRYAASFDRGHLEARAVRGLAVLTCIDSRIDPLQMLGLSPGDAKILRNAGARVTDDVIATLELAIDQLGVDHVAIVMHTDCAAATPDPEATLRADIDRLLAAPGIATSLPVMGLRYDVRTGLLAPLVVPRSSAPAARS
jgi:carbonic anhydrase